MTREAKAILIYTAPFATWIGLQTILPATAWSYALRSAATAAVGLFCWLRGPGVCLKVTLRGVFAGLLCGVAVAVLWIVPECSDFYRTWFCWSIGSLPSESAAPSPYDPSVCGWPLTIAKLVGSAFVIAPVEEMFFRSFLYRWLQRGDFRSVPLSRFDLQSFAWTVFLFTLEHDRPLAAATAGVLYGLVAVRAGLAGAIAAHVATNFLLALHVICSGAWRFW